MAEYDGRSDAVLVPITSVPVWVEVFGLPMDLWTKKALYMVGSMLGKVIHHDNQCLIHGKKARVRIEHQISSPVKQAFPPMLFEFGKGKDLIAAMLTFKYERMCGFCRVRRTCRRRCCTLGKVLGITLRLTLVQSLA